MRTVYDYYPYYHDMEPWQDITHAIGFMADAARWVATRVPRGRYRKDLLTAIQFYVNNADALMRGEKPQLDNFDTDYTLDDLRLGSRSDRGRTTYIADVVHGLQMLLRSASRFGRGSLSESVPRAALQTLQHLGMPTVDALTMEARWRFLDWNVVQQPDLLDAFVAVRLADIAASRALLEQMIGQPIPVRRG